MAVFGPTFFPPLGPPKMARPVEPTGWDRCVLAGQVLPGHSSILKGGLKLKKDPKDKAGTDGTHPTYHGLSPQPLEIENVTYSNEDREALASILLDLLPQPGKTPRPVSIDHPSLRILSISTVQLIGSSPIMPVPDKPGATKIKIEFDQWSPPKTEKSATTTPRRATRNIRREATEQNYVEKNPAPTAQPDLWQPPSFG